MRRTLLAGGGRRASRSHMLAASQAFERMHTLFAIGWTLRYTGVHAGRILVFWRVKVSVAAQAGLNDLGIRQTVRTA